jgi:hypothetical protein
MPFAYLRDPLFLASLAAYLVNRWVLKSIWADGFVHEHFNDLICIALCVPPMLFVARRLGLRRHDGPPDAIEIVVPLVIWSLLFELWLPATETFSPWAHADHRDIAYYAAGGLGASVFWNWRYRAETTGHRAAVDC